MDGAITSIAIVILLIAIFCGEAIFTLLAVREIRKMAASLPEAERLAWLDKELAGIGHKKKQTKGTAAE